MQLFEKWYGFWPNNDFFGGRTNPPVPPKGLTTLKEALKRVGVKTVQTRLECDYNAGRTTQVPAGRVVASRDECAGKLGTMESF